MLASSPTIVRPFTGANVIWRGIVYHWLRSTCAAGGLAALLVTVAAAQPSPGERNGEGFPSTVPVGSLQRVQDGWAARTLIGTPVFNDNRQRIATINDLLVRDGGAVEKVVLSVAQSRRLVVVRFDQLRFAPSESLGTPLGKRARRLSGIGNVARTDIGPYGVMLPGVSRDTLVGMEAFRRVPTL